MKDFKDLLGHIDSIEDDNDIVEFHICRSKVLHYALCKLEIKEIVCVCYLQIVFNKMCKVCLATLTPKELKDLKHYLVIRRLKNEL